MDRMAREQPVSNPVTTVYRLAKAEALLRENRFKEAELLYCQLIGWDGNNVILLLNYGAVLKELGRVNEAEPFLRRAVSLDPQSYAAWSNLGCVMLEQQHYNDAIAAFSNALKINSLHVPALSGLGVTFSRYRLLDEAITFYDLAISADPQNALLRHYRAMAILTKGDYEKGLVEYEWRLHTRNLLSHVIPAPHWKGEPINGRTLLVYDEGGLGDVLQFSRYLPLLKAWDCRVILRVPTPLVTLLGRLPAVDMVIRCGQPLPIFDLACSVMSLPCAFRTTIDTIPFSDGYLSADPVLLEEWAERLTIDASRFGQAAPLRVGLVWAGGKRPWNTDIMLMDHRRSIPLSALAPLAEAAPNILFYSLQIGEPEQEAAEPPTGMRLIDHTDRIHSFNDTAGLVSHLDLIIAVDTSTAHLAAALGRPVWLLSRYDQCWRWLIGREDTPWYSTMRLYTQPAPFDWVSPIRRMAEHLAHLAQTHGSLPFARPKTDHPNLVAG